MSKEGFDNEKEIANYLNGRKYSKLNPNMKRFINHINENSILDPDATICAETIPGLYKADLKVIINGKERKISVKKGGGNSFHQEKIEFFIDFIKNLGASSKVINYLKEFIDSYEDGEIYFSGRLDKKNAIQKFFNSCTKELLTRFLKTGKYPINHAEFIYHGTIDKGKFNEVESIISKMLNNPCVGCAQLYIGSLTFQKWNTRNESKRGSIQLKGPTIKAFLK